MGLRNQGALNRASFRLAVLLCPVIVLLVACGVAPAPLAEETAAAPQVEQSPAVSPAPPISEEPEQPPPPRPRRPEAPGSPLRVPLPTDELMGRPLSDAEPEMKGLIAEACGGSQCITLSIEPQGSLDPDGRNNCVTYVVSVPGTVAEEVDDVSSVPVLYVPRGGTITLVVDLTCDESVVTESPGSPSPAEPPVPPEVDESEQPNPGGDPSTSSVAPTP